jgi:hypothetical protein
VRLARHMDGARIGARTRARTGARAGAATAILVLLCAPLAAAAARLPGLLTHQSVRHPFQVRPAVVGFTGDGSAFLGGFDGGTAADHFGHMSWPTWTATVAIGTGAVWIDGCEPSCAGGTYAPSAVSVRAFAPREGHFTRMTLRFDYRGGAIVEELGVHLLRASPHVPGFYEYFIVGHSATPAPAG